MKRLRAGLLGLCLLLPFSAQAASEAPLPVQASVLPDPDSLIKAYYDSMNAPGFSAQMEWRVYRQGTAPLTLRAAVQVVDAEHQRVEIEEPLAFRGMVFISDQMRSQAYFPQTQLLLTDLAAALPRELFGLAVPESLEEVKQNYTFQTLKADFDAGQEVWIVELSSRHLAPYQNYDFINLTPRRRWWLAAQSRQLIKEQLFWDWADSDEQLVPSLRPFAERKFTLLNAAQEHLGPLVKSDASPQTLSLTPSGQSFSFSSLEAASRQGHQLNLPVYLPKGFKLRSIQVYEHKEGRFQVMNFSDGLSRMTVIIYPKTLKDLNQLFHLDSPFGVEPGESFPALFPVNFFSTANERLSAVVYGEIPPTELERVAVSLNY